MYGEAVAAPVEWALADWSSSLIEMVCAAMGAICGMWLGGRGGRRVGRERDEDGEEGVLASFGFWPGCRRIGDCDVEDENKSVPRMRLRGGGE